MTNKLTAIIITKNSASTLRSCLSSIKNLCDDIIVVDDYSKDKTINIAKEFNATTLFHHSNKLSQQRLYGINKAKGNWLLIIDSDEVVTIKLAKEIKKAIKSHYDSYYIKYQNHFLGKPINKGGENYKVLRLFKKNKFNVVNTLIHEKFIPSNYNFSTLKNKIFHYSYRSYFQILKKFTLYSYRNALEKTKKGEKTSLKKLFCFPIHMFWSRFIEDKGYEDGFFRLPLDLAFAYMEFLTYFLLLFL